MKRSTNLFYTVGSESNFITFSNYTESLTGNFLSVNTKLFPSNFLCLDIPSLTKENRIEFIQYIAAYYENKLAFLRDKCIENNYSIEDTLAPLDYLITAIQNYDNDFKIAHVGQITEQNYNGTYSDIICVITASEHNIGKLNSYQNDNLEKWEKYDASNKFLYGWYTTMLDGTEIYQGPFQYETIKPILDDNNKGYDYKKKLENITKEHSDENIKFNVIIPLYNVVNIDSNSNDSIIDETKIVPTYVTNVPLGMWFSGEQPIIISRTDNEYDPSWSLLLSSQFKPFPYSEKSPTDIDESAKSDAFLTFSQILIKQNKLLDKFNDLNKAVLELNNRVANVEGNLKSMGTSYNIDGLHKEIVDLQTQINEIRI